MVSNFRRQRLQEKVELILSIFQTGHVVNSESVRFRFRYFSQIQIYTPATSKSPVSSVKYQDENSNR